MSYREYIGARYVPLFADPLEWDSTQSYEPLTVVYHQGNSYTSRQAVPAGIEITNNTYWAQTGNYNAQIEQYRAEVAAYDARITANADNIASEATTRASADTAIRNELGADIADNTDAIEAIQDAIENKDTFVVFGDSWAAVNEGYEDWITPVNKVLNCGVVRNFSVGGATFVYNTTRVQQQITRASNEMSTVEKSHVKYVMIMAGVNDLHPSAPSGFATAVLTALRTCLVQFPNAVVQWFPSSCAPGYDTAAKWLHCASAFWQVASNNISGASSDYDTCNRIALPSCGPAFYFNEQTAIANYFRSDKLHLNAYGRKTIVNAILEGYGKLAFPYVKTSIFKPSGNTSRNVVTTITPTSVKLYGSFSVSSEQDLSYGTTGERVALAIAGAQSLAFEDLGYGEFVISPLLTGNGSCVGWCNCRVAPDALGARFATSGAANQGVVYIG